MSQFIDNPDLIAVCLVGDGENETGKHGNSEALNKLYRSSNKRGCFADSSLEWL
jgi:phosphoketolase